MRDGNLVISDISTILMCISSVSLFNFVHKAHNSAFPFSVLDLNTLIHPFSDCVIKCKQECLIN